MRNVLKVVLLGILLVALSSVVSAEADVTGFKGFAWGTDFETVNRVKDLAWYMTTDERGKHLGMKDAEVDEEGRLVVAYTYIFYNNKLVSGEIVFLGSHTRYLEAVKLLEDKFGKPQLSRSGKISGYVLKNTVIMCDSENNTIEFVSKQYTEDRIKRQKEAEKAKKDRDFDRLFN